MEYPKIGVGSLITNGIVLGEALGVEGEYVFFRPLGSMANAFERIKDVRLWTLNDFFKHGNPKYLK